MDISITFISMELLSVLYFLRKIRRSSAESEDIEKVLRDLRREIKV